MVHLASLVKLWGPLWSFSMFGFENMNGHLRSTYHGTRNVLKQLVFTVMLKQWLPFVSGQRAHAITEVGNMTRIDEHTYAIGRITKKKLNQTEKAALHVYGLLDVPDEVSVVGRILKNHVLLHSCLHKTDGTRNNRVCEFIDGTEHVVGEIDFFILWSTPLAMLKVAVKLDSTFSIRSSRLHSFDTSTNQYLKQFIAIEAAQSNDCTRRATPLSLLKKCVYIPVRHEQSDFIVTIPNHYEHH